MPRTPWHPYAADQAFGHQVARDQDLVDRLVDRLDAYRTRRTPRAGNKAVPSGPPGDAVAGWHPSDRQLSWIVAQDDTDGPVTTASVLDPGDPIEWRRG